MENFFSEEARLKAKMFRM